MSALRHLFGRHRHGLGWLGAGRVIAGLSAGFALVAIGFTGLQTNIVSLGGPSGAGDVPARPQLIPDVVASGGRVAFTGGARVGNLPVAGARVVTTPQPLSPSGGATPLPRHAAVTRSAAPRDLQAIAGPQEVVTAPQPTRATLRDADQDGASDSVERRLGTDVRRRDTDGDGMPDGWEVR